MINERKHQAWNFWSAFIFFGLVAVCGTYYVQALTVSPAAIWTAVPIGLLATAILVVNNLRDIQTDRAAGKKTLAVRFGRRGAQICDRPFLMPWALSRWVPGCGFGYPRLPGFRC